MSPAQGRSRLQIAVLCVLAALVIAIVLVSEYRERAELLGRKKRVMGIFCLHDLGASVVPLAAEPCWQSPGVSGLSILFAWDHAEPLDDQYQWERFDEAIALARQHGKKLAFTVNAGTSTPPWVYETGAQRFAGRRAVTGEPYVEPPPWDPVLRQQWEAFISAFGERYDTVPELSYVGVAGLTREPGDYFVDQSDDLQFFQSERGPSWLFDHWLPAALATLDAYDHAFPMTPFHLFLKPPSPVSPDGQAALERLLLEGRERLQRRFGLIANVSSAALGDPLPAHRLLRFFSDEQSAGVRIAQSEEDSHEGTLRDALDLAVDLNAHFVEIASIDASRPAFQGDLLAASELFAQSPFFSVRSSSASSGCPDLGLGLAPIGCYYNCTYDPVSGCQLACSTQCVENYPETPASAPPLFVSSDSSSSDSVASALSSAAPETSSASSTASSELSLPSSASSASSLSTTSSMGSSLASSLGSSFSSASPSSSLASSALSSVSSSSTASISSAESSSLPLSSSMSASSSSVSPSSSSVSPASSASSFSSVSSSSASSVAANNAQFVSQSGVPLTLQPNKTKSVSVTMRNTGTTTWTRATSYKLSSQNPADNMTWNLNRVPLPTTVNVPPGSQRTFTFTIRSPLTPGTYNFQWRMVQDGGAGFFGEFSPNVAIVVQ